MTDTVFLAAVPPFGVKLTAIACVSAAMELLEESGETALSLRAVARRAGVSPAAPYRHYADREALVSAVAALGYRELAERLAAARCHPLGRP
ncbi:MAG TPA: helix-turn-helix domain-containing protein [Solirubrobacteraceae bacterium]|nr:helix-turn-helix domain-containing protein [Solirubrobacteraceae bacterium]